MTGNRAVAVVATLDTKGAEAAYVCEQIAAWGLGTILIDPGVLPEPTVEADISRQRVAQAAGTTLEALLARGEKAFAIAKQTEGLCNIVIDLHQKGQIQGIVGLGGGQGTSIATAAMRALPIGVPKLMLSTVASGLFQFGPYVGTKDICMMHSVTDVLGLNVISRPILRNAANAIAGMVLQFQIEAEATRPTIAITMLGITTPCVMRVKDSLESQGYDVVPFHANGTSGPAMEQLIEQGMFEGVIDLSTHEVIDHQNGGLAGAPNRMEALSRTEIPAAGAKSPSKCRKLSVEEKSGGNKKRTSTSAHNPKCQYGEALRKINVSASTIPKTIDVKITSCSRKDKHADAH